MLNSLFLRGGHVCNVFPHTFQKQSATWCSFVIQALVSNSSRPNKSMVICHIWGHPPPPPFIPSCKLHCMSIGHIQYLLHVGSNPYAWFWTVYCVSIVLWRAHINSQFNLYRIDVNYIKEINLFYSILCCLSPFCAGQRKKTYVLVQFLSTVLWTWKTCCAAHPCVS